MPLTNNGFPVIAVWPEFHSALKSKLIGLNVTNIYTFFCDKVFISNFFSYQGPSIVPFISFTLIFNRSQNIN
jgi:hypothetical protein